MLRDLLQSTLHPKELSAIFWFKYSTIGQMKVKEPLADLALELSDREFCYAALNKVSRSFAAVIQQLPVELRDPVCIFYLVLRGLDSIEDDAEFPQYQKLPLLVSFYKKNDERNFRLNGVGDSPDYRDLLANYHKVARTFQKLDYKYRKVVSRICKKMGEGMAYFSEKPLQTTGDYNLYCHYVAGLVGIGLSDLFSISGIENSELKTQTQLSNSMGLFLQKTNIIRDYLEDVDAGRCFWPREIWEIYAGRLEDFKEQPASRQSLACLNHLVWDALQHLPDAIAYLEKIQNHEVFRFCAIPQVMAIATLEKVCNNPDVFTSVVKIRKGLTARLMLEMDDCTAFKKHVAGFTEDIAEKITAAEPNYERLTERCEMILNRCNKPEIQTAELIL